MVSAKLAFRLHYVWLLVGHFVEAHGFDKILLFDKTCSLRQIIVFENLFFGHNVFCSAPVHAPVFASILAPVYTPVPSQASAPVPAAVLVPVLPPDPAR